MVNLLMMTLRILDLNRLSGHLLNKGLILHSLFALTEKTRLNILIK